MVDYLVKFYRKGWRPLIGWVTVLAAFNLFVVCPLFGLEISENVYRYIKELFLLAAALGGFRTYEKYKGVG